MTRTLVGFGARGAGRGVVLLAALAALGAGGYCGARRALSSAAAEAPRTRVTHDLVVERVRAVARLVTSEATVRDVVVFENTQRFATKRVLLVVTGRVLAGIDLDSAAAAGGADVQIDHAARRIRVSLPPAELLGVEVVSVRTYDEQAGLLNPFRPADRDSIQLAVREQLARAGRDTGLLEHANRNAVALLTTLLAQDGYTVDASVRARPIVAPGG